MNETIIQKLSNDIEGMKLLRIKPQEYQSMLKISALDRLLKDEALLNIIDKHSSNTNWHSLSQTVVDSVLNKIKNQDFIDVYIKNVQGYICYAQLYIETLKNTVSLTNLMQEILFSSNTQDGKRNWFDVKFNQNYKDGGIESFLLEKLSATKNITIDTEWMIKNQYFFYQLEVDKKTYKQLFTEYYDILENGAANKSELAQNVSQNSANGEQAAKTIDGNLHQTAITATSDPFSDVISDSLINTLQDEEPTIPEHKEPHTAFTQNQNPSNLNQEYESPNSQRKYITVGFDIAGDPILQEDTGEFEAENTKIKADQTSHNNQQYSTSSESLNTPTPNSAISPKKKSSFSAFLKSKNYNIDTSNHLDDTVVQNEDDETSDETVDIDLSIHSYEDNDSLDKISIDSYPDEFNNALQFQEDVSPICIPPLTLKPSINEQQYDEIDKKNQLNAEMNKLKLQQANENIKNKGINGTYFLSIN